MPKENIELINFDGSLYKNFEKINTSVFYSTEWLKVLAESYNYKIKLLKISDELMLPFLEVRTLNFQKRLVSVPFSDQIEVNLQGLDSKITDCLQKLLKNYSQIELKTRIEGKEWYYNDENFSYILKIEGTENEIFERCHKTRVKQVVGKALKNNLESFHSQTPEALNQFYEVHKLTRKRLGVPVQPIKFFKTLYENILSKNKGFVGLVKLENKIISGCVFLSYKDTLIYKFSASDPEFLNLKPNHLMVWEGIRKAVRDNFQYFDFGKCEKFNRGLRDFKLGWNSSEIPILYSILSKTKIKMESENSQGNSLVEQVVKNTPDLLQPCFSSLYKYFG